MIILDYNKCPSLVDVDAQIKAAAEILYASPKNACLVMLPVRYHGQKTATHFANTRRVEDGKGLGFTVYGLGFRV